MRALLLILASATAACAEIAPVIGTVESEEICLDCFPGDDGGGYIVLASECTPDHAKYSLGGVIHEEKWSSPCTSWPGGGVVSCELNVNLGGGLIWRITCRFNYTCPPDNPTCPPQECSASLQ